MSKTRTFNFRASAVKAVLTVFVLYCTGCSVFRFGDYKSFGEWLRGPAGFSRALDGKEHRDGIEEERSWIYLHFRMFELVFQPAGGIKYPRRITVTNSSLGDAIMAGLEARSEAQSYGYGEATYTRVSGLRTGPKDSLYFDFFDAGLLEIIPYRTWASDEDLSYKIGMTLLQPFTTTVTGLFMIVRGPIYAGHDVVKTLTIPAAAIYYNTGSDEGEKETESN